MKYFNRSKLQGYAQLARFNKPIGSLLLLWPTLWALFLAQPGIPPLSILLIFILGVILMRGAGCVINDFADRHIDGHVKRTRHRPLVTGVITEKEAKLLFAIMVGISFILVLFLNRFALFLSVCAVILAFIYPFMKRYTHLPQFILGMAFGWSIPMAYATVHESLPLSCWLLFLANVAWTVAYDTQYAMVDRDDDLRIGVKSTAILFAQYDNKIIALLQIITLSLFLCVGYIEQLHYSYFIGIALSSFILVYQCKTTKSRLREDCFNAFMSNNYFGMAIFIAILFGLFY